jgi:hypothetical protein
MESIRRRRTNDLQMPLFCRCASGLYRKPEKLLLISKMMQVATNTNCSTYRGAPEVI